MRECLADNCLRSAVRVGSLQALPSDGSGRSSGTRVLFKPDPHIFTTTTDFDYSTLSTRLRELAFLNSGLAISLVFNGRAPGRGKGSGGQQKRDSYCFEGGLQEYVRWVGGGDDHRRIVCEACSSCRCLPSAGALAQLSNRR